MTDIDTLRRDTSVSNLALSYGVGLQKNGNEFEGCCPFHSEKTPSFTIYTGRDGADRFHCFGCGEHGDAVDFVMKIKGVDTREAISILGGGDRSRPNIAPRQIAAPIDVYAGIELLVPSQFDLITRGARTKIWNPKRSKWGEFAPSMVFPYFQADGARLGYVLRHDLSDGGKETPMVCRVRLPDGEECWSRFPFPRPRPLYIGGGKATLADGQVIVVEGEKCADAMVRASDRQTVSWCGGTFGIEHTDWSPLKGRSCVIWPDADKAGGETAERVAEILAGLGCVVKLLDLAAWDGPALSKGWDCADAIDGGWGRADLDAFLRATVKVWTPREPTSDEVENPPAPHAETAPPAETAPAAPVRQARQTRQEQPANVVSLQAKREERAADGGDWRAQLVMNENGNPKPGVQMNWSLILENHPATRGLFGYDAFKLNIMLMRAPPWEGAGAHWTQRTLKDTDFANAAMWLEGQMLTPKPTTIVPIINALAERNHFDRLQEYLEGLKWDGRPRIANWMRDYLGAGDGRYASIVGMRFLISAVARGLAPGSKVDTMPILEGSQGARKSTALETLFSKEFFTDELSDVGSKDAMIEMSGVWCIEIAEMQRFSSADANAVKKFLSRKADRYRPPYGRTLIETPRRVVLAGTINPEGSNYLKDPTGARRFWPVEVGRIDIDELARDRDQLWAEAVVEWRKGTPHWVQPDETVEVEEQQSRRTDVDVWTDMIADFVETRTDVLLSEVLSKIGIATKDMDHRHAARVGRVMKKLGWLEARDRGKGTDRIKYLSPMSPENDIADVF